MPLRLVPLAAAGALLMVLGLTQPANAALPPESTWHSDVSRAVADWSKIDRRYDKGVRDGDKMGINLDIDNTSIATHYDYPHAVSQVLSIARHYRDKDVKLLFNTGRYSDELDGIKAALTNAGYRYTIVCGRRHGLTIEQGKQRCRDRFIDYYGYTLLANFGNTDHDFAGTRNWSYSFKLPDYNGQLT